MRSLVRALVLVGLCAVSTAALAQGCGSSWEWLSPLPHGDHLYGAAWADGLFVAVGDLGRIQTSRDGRSWTYPAPVTRQPLLDVCWGNGRWVAVGRGVILVSQDGTAWTPIPSGTTASLLACTFSGNQFVAVGWYGAILTSPDGLQWTTRSTGTGNDLFSVTSGGGVLVAVGWGGTVLTSSDGQHWAQRRLAGRTACEAASTLDHSSWPRRRMATRSRAPMGQRGPAKVHRSFLPALWHCTGMAPGSWRSG